MELSGQQNYILGWSVAAAVLFDSLLHNTSSSSSVYTAALDDEMDSKLLEKSGVVGYGLFMSDTRGVIGYDLFMSGTT
jgi:hypothetical protein